MITFEGWHLITKLTYPNKPSISWSVFLSLYVELGKSRWNNQSLTDNLVFFHCRWANFLYFFLCLNRMLNTFYIFKYLCSSPTPGQIKFNLSNLSLKPTCSTFFFSHRSVPSSLGASSMTFAGGSVWPLPSSFLKDPVLKAPLVAGSLT